MRKNLQDIYNSKLVELNRLTNILDGYINKYIPQDIVDKIKIEFDKLPDNYKIDVQLELIGRKGSGHKTRFDDWNCNAIRVASIYGVGKDVTISCNKKSGVERFEVIKNNTPKNLSEKQEAPNFVEHKDKISNLVSDIKQLPVFFGILTDIEEKNRPQLDQSNLWYCVSELKGVNYPSWCKNFEVGKFYDIFLHLNSYNGNVTISFKEFCDPYEYMSAAFYDCHNGKYLLDSSFQSLAEYKAERDVYKDINRLDTLIDMATEEIACYEKIKNPLLEYKVFVIYSDGNSGITDVEKTREISEIIFENHANLIEHNYIYSHYKQKSI